MPHAALAVTSRCRPTYRGKKRRPAEALGACKAGARRPVIARWARRQIQAARRTHSFAAQNPKFKTIANSYMPFRADEFPDNRQFEVSAAGMKRATGLR